MRQTDAKRAANRANAQRSTGPKTRAGKHRVRRNALRHGLYAETAPDTGEDGAIYAHLFKDLVRRFAPKGSVEIALVARVASLNWRLSRVGPAEHAVYAAHEEDFVPEDGHEEEVAVDLPDLWAAAHRAGPIDSAIARINRHEAHLQRMVTRTMEQLTLMQSLRTGSDPVAATRAQARAQVQAEAQAEAQARAKPDPLDPEERAAFEAYKKDIEVIANQSEDEAWDAIRDLLNQYQELVPQHRFSAGDLKRDPTNDGLVMVRKPGSAPATPAEGDGDAPTAADLTASRGATPRQASPGDGQDRGQEAGDASAHGHDAPTRAASETPPADDVRPPPHRRNRYFAGEARSIVTGKPFSKHVKE